MKGSAYILENIVLSNSSFAWWIIIFFLSSQGVNYGHSTFHIRLTYKEVSRSISCEDKSPVSKRQKTCASSGYFLKTYILRALFLPKMQNYFNSWIFVSFKNGWRITTWTKETMCFSLLFLTGTCAKNILTNVVVYVDCNSKNTLTACTANGLHVGNKAPEPCVDSEKATMTEDSQSTNFPSNGFESFGLSKVCFTWIKYIIL